ncbi:hypothetical protein D1646_07495 [Pseudoflavonifractor sp. 60]|uniref:hypothetical protein n=1 Tax=Pseudoflavonifractor sp. 60 TaxID=2304576 RepID=UPI001370B1E3|nr:hypothetical protein [Pseudoflavonifractor sp. 60]MCI8914679.1 hypothetical protein [Lawsonibacter sp.]NBI66663.1 hypothetical protein [Pseudoflavonifractor sp. 60]
MRTLRSTFEENYRAVPEPSGNRRGFKMRYIYIGPWYIWNLPRERVQTAKRLMGAACIFSILLFFSGAFLNSPLNHDRYVSLTGMLSIAALVFEVFGAAQFCAAREKMTTMDFHDIQTKLMLAPLAHGVLLLITAAFAVRQLLRWDGFVLTDTVVPMCYALSGILSLLMFFYFRSLPIRKEKNKDWDIGLSS